MMRQPWVFHEWGNQSQTNSPSTSRTMWHVVGVLGDAPGRVLAMGRSGSVRGRTATVAVVDDAAPQGAAGDLADHRYGRRSDSYGVHRPPSVALPGVPDWRGGAARSWTDLLVVRADDADRRPRAGGWGMGVGTSRFLRPERGAAGAIGMAPRGGLRLALATSDAVLGADQAHRF